MAKLTTAARNNLSASAFALPGRRYPIENASHARNALARVAQHGTVAERATVRSKVHKRFPTMGVSHPHRNLGKYLHPKKGA